MLGHSSGQHGGVVLFVDYPLVVTVFLQQAGGHVVRLETTATLPVDRLGDATLVGAVTNLV